MANWCSVEAEIVCFDGREAETLYHKLLNDKTEADKLERGLYIGSNRYFFDSTIEVNGDTITLNGSVKWGFTDDEILAFIKHLKSVVSIKSAEIKYEETGCLIYGCFSYEDGILYDTYLPESKSKKKTELPSALRNVAAISLPPLKKKNNFMNYGTAKQSLTVPHKVIFW